MNGHRSATGPSSGLCIPAWTARLSLTRESAVRPVAPWVETRTHWILTGLHTDLDEAMRRCADQAVGLLVHRTGMTATEAYLYLSAAGDFAVTQVVDITKGVHCMIRRSGVEAGRS